MNLKTESLWCHLYRRACRMHAVPILTQRPFSLLDPVVLGNFYFHWYFQTHTISDSNCEISDSSNFSQFHSGKFPWWQIYNEVGCCIMAVLVSKVDTVSNNMIQFDKNISNSILILLHHIFYLQFSQIFL